MKPCRPALPEANETLENELLSFTTSVIAAMETAALES